MEIPAVECFEFAPGTGFEILEGTDIEGKHWALLCLNSMGESVEVKINSEIASDLSDYFGWVKCRLRQEEGRQHDKASASQLSLFAE